MTSGVLDGIGVERVRTDRYTASVLRRGEAEAGTPVVFVHGNVSSSLFWQPTMLALEWRRSRTHHIAGDRLGAWRHRMPGA